MSKNQKQIKESTHVLRKKESKGHQPVVAVRRRAASSDESAAIERAIDGLLTELVRQARVSGSQKDE